MPCGTPIKLEHEDDKYQEDDSLTYDIDILKREIGDQEADNSSKHISMGDRTGENHLVLQYKCNLCNYQTKKKRNFALHQKSKHEGVKYTCNQCDFQANQKSYLVVHQK